MIIHLISLPYSHTGDLNHNVNRVQQVVQSPRGRLASSAQDDTDVESMYDNTGLIFETKRAPAPPKRGKRRRYITTTCCRI